MQPSVFQCKCKRKIYAIFENRVKVDVFVNIAYGYNIPVTCGKVQDKVKTTIENMTGLTVTDVNVRVVAVSMPNNK